MKKNKLDDEPILLYLTPESAKGLGFVLWEHCRQKSIRLVIMPDTIHMSFRKNDHGIFKKIINEFTFNHGLK